MALYVSVPPFEDPEIPIEEMDDEPDLGAIVSKQSHAHLIKCPFTFHAE